MARGMLLPAELMALVVILVLVHQTCSAEGSHHCPPSSCGTIRNISYPFRLEGDPEHCGDPRYTLSCENDQTVLNLYAGKYNVRAINYNNNTIRVVDPGILNDTDSFVPRYSLDYTNFISGDPYKWKSLRSVVFVNCEKPLNSGMRVDISSCFKNGVYSSNSSLSHPKRYRYVLLDAEWGFLEDLCQVEQISLSPEHVDDLRDDSCTDIHNKFSFGFELLWYQVYCGKRCRHGYCYLDEANNVTCDQKETGLFLKSLVICTKVLIAVINKLVPRKIRDKFGVATYESNGVTDQVFRKLLGSMLYFVGPYFALRIVLGVPSVIAFLICKWRRRHLSIFDAVEEFLESHNNLMPIRYSYSEIRKMTKSFKDKLGEGGYGTVFKGKLQSGRLVAIKMLGKSKTNGQDFINEVATIGRIHHVNVVQLIGFCVEGSKRALVYEFMSNGSLNKYIFLPEINTLLSYHKMYDIALGVARGIEYLHQGCDMQILHFDIKPHNILLDKNFTPKVSDFGLAKLYPVNDSIVSLTAARGTLGYMAPELFYKNIGGVSYKADVYSFGMLLMEMAGRRRNVNAFEEHSSKIYFPTWVYDQLNDGNDIEMEEATDEEKKIGKKMIIVALWCIQMKPSVRPSMNKVVKMLEGEVEYLQMPSKPFLSSLESITIGGGENSNESNESNESSQSSQI